MQNRRNHPLQTSYPNGDSVSETIRKLATECAAVLIACREVDGDGCLLQEQLQSTSLDLGGALRRFLFLRKLVPPDDTRRVHFDHFEALILEAHLVLCSFRMRPASSEMPSPDFVRALLIDVVSEAKHLLDRDFAGCCDE